MARGVAPRTGGPVRAMGKALGPTRRSRRRDEQLQEAGAAQNPSAVVDCGLYVDGHRREGTTPYADALRAAREAGGDAFVWIGLHEPSFEEFSGLAEAFGLHPLAVEDAVHAHQRPKLERYGDTTFFVLKTARYIEHEAVTGNVEIIDTGEVMLFVGENFLVTVRHGSAAPLSGVRAQLDHSEKMLRHGPWAVAYAIADRVVDEYLDAAQEFDTDIDEVETSVFSPRVSSDVQRLYQLKRELLELRRCVVPLARPLASLTGGAVEGVPAEVARYFRDVEDHLQRVTEQVLSFDDLLTTILEANLAQIGVQQNNDMRKISAWVAIAAIPTMIAGIYGMNFRYMPELQWHYGYFGVLAVMFVICTGLYGLFRRSGWL